MCLVALGIVLEARTFRVGFYTDPLGPGGLPFLVALLLGAGGAALAWRPARHSEWKRGKLPATAYVVVCLISYAALLPRLGFLASTAGVLVAMARGFGGPLRRSVALSLAYTAVLYVVFSLLLGLPLPVGTLFVRGGGG
jgi:putative tricarboxylic transport membrane protein